MNNRIISGKIKSGLALLVLISSAFVLAPPVKGGNTQDEKTTMATSSLEQRGKQLRAAIEQAYKRLVDSKTYRGDDTDITDLVAQYIPIGTSFDDAEQILHSAGFGVDPRPSANAKDDFLRSADVVAHVDGFDHASFSKTSVYVFLHPKTPGDFSVVSKVAAGIVTTTL